jgi:hypothetical protein
MVLLNEEYTVMELAIIGWALVKLGVCLLW